MEVNWTMDTSPCDRSSLPVGISILDWHKSHGQEWQAVISRSTVCVNIEFAVPHRYVSTPVVLPTDRRHPPPGQDSHIDASHNTNDEYRPLTRCGRSECESIYIFHGTYYIYLTL